MLSACTQGRARGEWEGERGRENEGGRKGRAGGRAGGREGGRNEEESEVQCRDGVGWRGGRGGQRARDATACAMGDVRGENSAYSQAVTSSQPFLPSGGDSALPPPQAQPSSQRRTLATGARRHKDEPPDTKRQLHPLASPVAQAAHEPAGFPGSRE